MGRPKGDPLRSKNRPSSSSLAASSLQNSSSLSPSLPSSATSSLPAGGFGGYFGSTRIDTTNVVHNSVHSATDKIGIAQHQKKTKVKEEVYLGVDSEISLHLKRLSKKDPTTKVKALAALTQLAEREGGQLAALPSWVFEYRSLSYDSSRQVREASHHTMGAMASSLGRGLAPHIKSLLGPWWVAHFDNSPEVSDAARRAFQISFPARKKQIEALSFCSSEIILHINENLKLTPKKENSDSVQNYEEVISSSLLALSTLLNVLVAQNPTAVPLPRQHSVSSAPAVTRRQKMPLEQGDQQVTNPVSPPGTVLSFSVNNEPQREPVGNTVAPETVPETLSKVVKETVPETVPVTVPVAVQETVEKATMEIVKAHHWMKDFVRSKNIMVRESSYLFMATLTQRFSHQLSDPEVLNVVAPVVLSGLGERESICHGAMWQMVLLFGRRFPQVWDLPAVSIRKAVLPKILAFLGNGCFGSGLESYPCLLPLLSLLSLSSLGTSPSLYHEFLGALWEGHLAVNGALEKRHLTVAMRECLVFSVKAIGRNVQEIDPKLNPKSSEILKIEEIQSQLIESILLKKVFYTYIGILPKKSTNEETPGFQISSGNYRDKTKWISDLSFCMVETLSSLSKKDKEGQLSPSPDLLERFWKGFVIVSVSEISGRKNFSEEIFEVAECSASNLEKENENRKFINNGDRNGDILRAEEAGKRVTDFLVLLKRRQNLRGVTSDVEENAVIPLVAEIYPKAKEEGSVPAVKLLTTLLSVYGVGSFRQLASMLTSASTDDDVSNFVFFSVLPWAQWAAEKKEGSDEEKDEKDVKDKKDEKEEKEEKDKKLMLVEALAELLVVFQKKWKRQNLWDSLTQRLTHPLTQQATAGRFPERGGKGERERDRTEGAEGAEGEEGRERREGMEGREGREGEEGVEAEGRVLLLIKVLGKVKTGLGGEGDRKDKNVTGGEFCWYSKYLDEVAVQVASGDKLKNERLKELLRVLVGNSGSDNFQKKTFVSSEALEKIFESVLLKIISILPFWKENWVQYGLKVIEKGEMREEEERDRTIETEMETERNSSTEILTETEKREMVKTAIAGLEILKDLIWDPNLPEKVSKVRVKILEALYLSFWAGERLIKEREGREGERLESTEIFNGDIIDDDEKEAVEEEEEGDEEEEEEEEGDGNEEEEEEDDRNNKREQEEGERESRESLSFEVGEAIAVFSKLAREVVEGKTYNKIGEREEREAGQKAGGTLKEEGKRELRLFLIETIRAAILEVSERHVASSDWARRLCVAFSQIIFFTKTEKSEILDLVLAPVPFSDWPKWSQVRQIVEGEREGEREEEREGEREGEKGGEDLNKSEMLKFLVEMVNVWGQMGVEVSNEIHLEGEKALLERQGLEELFFRADESVSGQDEETGEIDIEDDDIDVHDDDISIGSEEEFKKADVSKAPAGRSWLVVEILCSFEDSGRRKLSNAARTYDDRALSEASSKVLTFLQSCSKSQAARNENFVFEVVKTLISNASLAGKKKIQRGSFSNPYTSSLLGIISKVFVDGGGGWGYRQVARLIEGQLAEGGGEGDGEEEGQVAPEVLGEIVPAVMRVWRFLGREGGGEEKGVGGRGEVEGVVMEWVQKAMIAPPLVACMEPNRISMDSLESVQLAVSCFPLPQPGTTCQLSLFLKPPGGAASLVEQLALLELFRRQFSRAATSAVAASAAAKRFSVNSGTVSNSSSDSMSISLPRDGKEVADVAKWEERVEGVLAGLVTVTVAYSWRQMRRDDWTFVFKKLRKWLEMSLHVVEETVEAVAEIGAGEGEGEREGKGVEEGETVGNVEGDKGERGSEKSLDKLREVLISSSRKLEEVARSAVCLFGLLYCLLGSSERDEAGVLQGREGEGEGEGEREISGVEKSEWESLSQRAYADIVRIFLSIGLVETVAKRQEISYEKQILNQSVESEIATWRLSMWLLWETVSDVVRGASDKTIGNAIRALDLWGIGQGHVASLYSLFLDRESGKGRGTVQKTAVEFLCRPSVLPGTVSVGVGEGVGSGGEKEGREGERKEGEGAADVARVRPELAQILELTPGMLTSRYKIAEYFLGWTFFLHRIKTLPLSDPSRDRLSQFANSVGGNFIDVLFQHIPFCPESSVRRSKNPSDRAGKSWLLPKEAETYAAAARGATGGSVLFALENFWPVNKKSIKILAGALYGVILREIPALPRLWFLDLRDRAVQQRVENFTAAQCSPHLMAYEFQQALTDTENQSGLSVRVNRSQGEIFVSHQIDESHAEIALKMPFSYPLRSMEVECRQHLGQSKSKVRTWVLTITGTVRHRIGAVGEAIVTWKYILENRFEGLEECPICYSLVHLTDKTVPKLACKTCKHKFHGACLYKWFSSSHKSTCPLCQSPF